VNFPKDYSLRALWNGRALLFQLEEPTEKDGGGDIEENDIPTKKRYARFIAALRRNNEATLSLREAKRQPPCLSMKLGP